MQVYLYSFKKRENSTAYPLPSEGKLFNVQLKNETSFLTPTLRMSVDNLTAGLFSPAAYNYAFIPYWRRYYYITDWIYTNACWECNLSIDVLASFKGEIGNTSAYIVRADSAFNGSVADGLYPPTTNNQIIATALSRSIDINHGCYIVGITNCIDSLYRKGTITYYALDENDLNKLVQFMYSGSIYNMSNITDISEGLYKAIQNPMQYITSCVWVPIEASLISGHPVTTLDIGYWANISGTSGRVLEGTVFGKTNYYQLPNHPQISRGSYLNFAPYSRYTLYYPPFGAIQLDSNFRNAGDYLCIHLSVDCINGQSNLRLSMQNNNTEQDQTTRKIICERSGQAGIPIQLSQAGSDILSGVVGTIGSVISAVSGNYAGAASGILGTAAGLTDQKPNSMGYNGSFLATYDYPILISEFYRIADEDRTELGRPLMEVRTINTLAGYIKVAKDDHSFSGTVEETKKINEYLSGGFFYE